MTLKSASPLKTERLVIRLFEDGDLYNGKEMPHLILILEKDAR